MQKSSNNGLVSVVYQKGERPPPLSIKQQQMLAKLSNLSDDEIDTSDDWQATNPKSPLNGSGR